MKLLDTAIISYNRENIANYEVSIDDHRKIIKANKNIVGFDAS